MDARHVPVLAREVRDGLALTPGATVLDGTLGLGGHAGIILAATAPDGVLIGVDRDARNIAIARENLSAFGDRVRYVNDSFANVAAHHVPRLDGALLDLGFSSVHVDDASRGFSFMHDGPLDMRYDTTQETTAAGIVNGWTRDDLATIFRLYGEDPYAHVVAKAITEARKKEKFTTTGQLASLILSLAGGKRGKIHPATRVFQALRIAVNDELGELTRGLDALTTLLAPGGRLAIITFHSLEDRIVKQFFRDDARLTVLTKKPIVATDTEARENPRARSAKLRIAIKET